MLQHNINLSYVDLSGNDFGDSVGPYLAEAFKVKILKRLV